MKRIGIYIIAGLAFFDSSAQTNNLPVKEWPSVSLTPLILYISGDGGFNNFSTGLCTMINKAGYHIIAVNARSYFWDKKTPAQAVKDITAYLDKQFQNRRNQQLVLSGYSFGADVMPFIVNALPDSIKRKLVSVVLLSPSPSTDFEIHWLDIFGGSRKRDMDVVAELNKLGSIKTVTIVGDDEDSFPVKNISLKNYSTESLPGGHHFDNDTDQVAKSMMKYFK